MVDVAAWHEPPHNSRHYLEPVAFLLYVLVWAGVVDGLIGYKLWEGYKLGNLVP